MAEGENDDVLNEINENKELKNTKCNLHYQQNSIKNFDLPSSLYDFRTKVKQLFQIEDRNSDDIIIKYSYCENNNKKKEQLREVKSIEDYQDLIEKLDSGDVKDQLLLIETDHVLSEISGKIPETFEDEIHCVIENELLAASERIKKFLSANQNLFPSSKIQKNKTCYKCGEEIIGNIYKCVTSNDLNFCKKCMLNQKEPTFIIH
jgi:predicted RNA-binding Zn-ribbon protein involved in translation (DUF1610 family)